MAADSDISLLTRGSTLSKASCKTWPSQPAEEDEPHVRFVPPEGGVPSPQLRCSESESSSIYEATSETRPSDAAQGHLSISIDTSQTSLRSTDTTLEYYDAPPSKDQEPDEVQTEEDKEMVTVKPTTEEETSPTTESGHSGLLSENREEEEEAAVVTDDKTLEDTIESVFEQEAKTEEEALSEEEDEQDVESHREQEETHHDHVSVNQVTENTHFDTEDQPVNIPEQDLQSRASGFTESIVCLKPPDTDEPEDEAQSADLTAFVDQYLFGSDLSSPLTRSGIHTVSLTEAPLSSEFVAEEEEQVAAEAPPVFSSQKSTVSVTSSEPTGTDSHSVVSLNDSEELSSPVSEEEEDAESDQAEEDVEKEDSGSEVEIIEEVQGNGRLPPLQPTSIFVQQGHTHFLPSVSEQEAHFSLITPGAEMKMVEEDMEGEVVMVRLGADEGCIHPDQDQVQASPFVELKPSTTLLVPLELVEEQHDLVDCAQLGLSEFQQTLVPDDLRTDSHSSFSLILDMEEAKAEEVEQASAEAPPVFSSQKATVSVTSSELTGTDSHSAFSLILDVEEDADRDAHSLSIEKDLLSTDLFSQCPAEEASDEHMTKPEDVLLDPTQDNPPTGDPSQQAPMKPMDGSDGPEFDGVAESEPVSHQAILEPEKTEVNQGTVEAEEQTEIESLMLPQDQEPAAPAGDEQSTHSLRRSRRLIQRSSKVESTPLDTLEEGVLAPPVGAKASETEPALLEKEPIKVASKKTPQSKRVSLNTLSQSTKKPTGKKSTDRTNSRRPTRNKLWDHPEEDLLLLDSPLEVDSETPVADALIKRLQDEEEKQEGAVGISKLVRTTKRSTRSSVEPVGPFPATQEPQDEQTGPGEHSFVYSPSRRSRASRVQSGGPKQEPLTPVTRSRSRATRDQAAQAQVTFEEEASILKTSKQTARSKDAVELPPVAEVDLISPLPSPADPLPRARKVVTGEAPTLRMNLRRKRMMENIFTKPVTRRKKL